MAEVPIIQDSEQLQTGTGRSRIQADASAFGGLEARALSRVQQGLNKLDQVAQEKEDEANELNARDLDNQLVRRLRDRMYNPESGYISTQSGQNAIDGRTQAETDVDALAAEIGAQARNSRARAMYEQLARQRATSALGDIATHATREMRAHEDDVFETGLTENTDSAVAAYGDVNAVNESVAAGVASIRQFGERRGWGAEVTQAREEQFRSGVMQRVIVQLAQTDYQQAEDLYNQIRPSLTSQDAGELLTTMRAVRRQADDAAIDEAWTYVARGAAIPDDLWNSIPGRAQIDIQNERRRRIEGGSNLGNRTLVEDLTLQAMRDPDAFARVDLQSIRGQLGSSFVPLSRAQIAIQQGTEPQTAQDQRTTFNALSALAESSLAPYGLDLSPGERDRQGQIRANTFNAALLRELQSYQASNNGMAPTPEDAQMLIGRAWVSLTRAEANSAQTQVRGNRGREGQRRGQTGSQVAPTTEVVIPYAAIPTTNRDALVRALQQRLQRPPTQGEVENAYAAYLSGRPLNSVIRGAN